LLGMRIKVDGTNPVRVWSSKRAYLQVSYELLIESW
jgi:hypothetical protein